MWLGAALPVEIQVAGKVQLVFVVRDRVPAVVGGRRPAQPHLPVAGRGSQSLRRLRLRDRGRGRLRTGGPARPGAIDRSHPEAVGLFVGQAHHRVAGGRAAGRGPGAGTVQLVFVVREGRPAGGLDPTEPHPLVAGRGAEAKRRVRRHQRGRRRGRLRTGGRALSGAVDRPHPERVGLAVGQVAHRGARGLAAGGGPGAGKVQLVFVAQDRRPAVRCGRRPDQHHALIADGGVQTRRRVRHPRRRDARRGGGGRARPDAVEGPHLEPVGQAVHQARHRGARGRPAGGDPGPGPVLLVFVAGDRLPAVRGGRRPVQRHLLVAGRDADVPRRAGHRGRGDARRGGGRRTPPGAVGRPHPERVALAVGQVAHRVVGVRAPCGDPGAGNVLLVLVVRDLRAAGGLDPTEHHLPVAARGAEARRHVRRSLCAGLPRT